MAQETLPPVKKLFCTLLCEVTCGHRSLALAMWLLAQHGAAWLETVLVAWFSQAGGYLHHGIQMKCCCHISPSPGAHRLLEPSQCHQGIQLSPWAQLLGLSPHSTYSFSAIHHLVLCLMSSCNFLLSSKEMFSREATSSTSSVCRLDVMEQWLC